MVCSKEVHIFKWEELYSLTPISGLPFHRDATETAPTTDLHSAQKALKDITLHPFPSPPKHFDSLEFVSSVIRTRDRQSLIFEVGPFFAHGQERLRKKRVELFHTLTLEIAQDGEDHRIPLQASISGLSGMVSKVIGS
jgi:hypothetical protein